MQEMQHEGVSLSVSLKNGTERYDTTLIISNQRLPEKNLFSRVVKTMNYDSNVAAAATKLLVNKVAVA
jgi:hypothetical protein